MATVTLVSSRVLRCSDCGQSWHPSQAGVADSHLCVDDDDFVATTGRCEDFPACGHRLGECGDRAEFTSAYWHDLQEQMGDERYSEYCEALDRQTESFGFM